MKNILHRVLPLMLALVMALSLAACGNPAADSDTSKAPENNSAAPQQSQAGAPTAATT